MCVRQASLVRSLAAECESLLELKPSSAQREELIAWGGACLV